MYSLTLLPLTRGRHGVVRRVVDINTGRQYAANFMHMRSKAQKTFFMSEFEALRKLARTDGVLRLVDAFETERTLILVTEMYPFTADNAINV